MGTDFVLQVKYPIFWLNRGLRVYLDLYAPDFPKSTSKYYLHPITFQSKTPYFGGVFGKNHPNHEKKKIWQKKNMKTQSKLNLIYKF